MTIKAGEIMCLKTTGEIVCVLGEVQPGDRVYIRRPIQNQAGISHASDTVYQFELEEPLEHFRKEAKEMLDKADIQREFEAEMRKRVSDREPIERVN